jgi:hypothetical protein
MLRHSINCLLCLFLVVSAPSISSAEPAHPKRASTQKVYLFRGFMNVFSPGLDQFADEFRVKGVDVAIASHTDASAVAESAIQDCKSGKVSSIAIIGHSAGSKSAVAMAEQLKQAGIGVSLIVTLDPVVNLTVPGNVRRLENFYLSDGWGKAVQGGKQFRGSLQNADLKGDPEIGHISVTTSRRIHARVLQSVAAAASKHCR